MRIVSVLSKLSILCAGGYSAYKLLPSKKKSEIEGYINSSVNSIVAAKVLSSSVFDYYYSLRGLDYSTAEYHKTCSEVHTRVAKRILSLSVRSRGIYFKAGQFLGSLDGIMPKEFTETLCVLQDSAPPLDYNVIKTVIENDLPGALEEFESFETQALAAASLAQVHRAKLKSGETVAVKIQYPFLLTQTPTDFLVLGSIARIINLLLKLNRFEGIDSLKLWSTFRDMCLQEIDFHFEKENSEKTKKMFTGNSSLYVPHVYSELSSSRVLTMEFVSGHKISELDKIKEMGFDSKKIAKMLIRIFSQMIFVHGHVHCDPHPGNILVRSVNGKPQIILLDHGYYRYIPDEFRLDFCKLWHALSFLDYGKVKDIGGKMGLGEFYWCIPLVLAYKPIKIKKIVEEAFIKEEFKEMQNDSKAVFDSAFQFVQSVNPDFMFIVKISNLIALHNFKLGGSTKYRLLKYSDCSISVLYSGTKLYWEKLKFYFFLVFFNIISYFKQYN